MTFDEEKGTHPKKKHPALFNLLFKNIFVP